MPLRIGITRKGLDKILRSTGGAKDVQLLSHRKTRSAAIQDGLGEARLRGLQLDDSETGPEEAGWQVYRLQYISGEHS